MERQPIEGPEPYIARLSSHDAGQWLGKVDRKTFDRLMAQHLPTVQPLRVGKKKLWNWMDVAILGYVIGRGNAPELPDEVGNEEDD